jgi:hypothetical protein
MSRITLVIILVLGSFIVAALTAGAAVAAPAVVATLKAPKGVSKEFITALQGVGCSYLYEGQWALVAGGDEPQAALELLSAEEAAKFDAMAAKWAKTHCGELNYDTSAEQTMEGK